MRENPRKRVRRPHRLEAAGKDTSPCSLADFLPDMELTLIFLTMEATKGTRLLPACLRASRYGYFNYMQCMSRIRSKIRAGSYLLPKDARLYAHTHTSIHVL
jgi:hypothetical protein